MSDEVDDWAARLAALNRQLAAIAEKMGDAAVAWRLYAEADELERSGRSGREKGPAQ